MLPTNEASSLLLAQGKLYYTGSNTESPKNSSKNQHLYLTSDEEIKKDDWFYYPLVGTVRQYLGAEDNLEISRHKVFKVIATTDKSLTLPQIYESFIKVYVEANGDIKEVLVEYIKKTSHFVDQHDTSTWFKGYYTIKLRPDNAVITHSSTKTYTEDDMRRAFECGRNFQLTGENNLDEILNQIYENNQTKNNQRHRK